MSSVICGKRLSSEAFGTSIDRCSPRKIAFLDLAQASLVFRKPAFLDLAQPSMVTGSRKRNFDRIEGDEENAGVVERKAPRGLDGNVILSRQGIQEQSSFGCVNFPSSASKDNADTPKLCRACKQHLAEQLHTGEEVREIVQKAVALKEGEIRAEYDQVLQARLAEQYNSFRRFHEDYVSRQLNQSSYSYMS